MHIAAGHKKACALSTRCEEPEFVVVDYKRGEF